MHREHQLCRGFTLSERKVAVAASSFELLNGGSGESTIETSPSACTSDRAAVPLWISPSALSCQSAAWTSFWRQLTSGDSEPFQAGSSLLFPKESHAAQAKEELCSTYRPRSACRKAAVLLTIPSGSSGGFDTWTKPTMYTFEG